jgi:hypothetical protein
MESARLFEKKKNNNEGPLNRIRKALINGLIMHGSKTRPDSLKRYSKHIQLRVTRNLIFYRRLIIVPTYLSPYFIPKSYLFIVKVALILLFIVNIVVINTK